MELPGLNIQYPISNLILNGSKTIETRHYPLPEKYINKELAFIETPGKLGDFKARIMGTIVFASCFKYLSEEDFYMDMDKHKVTPDSLWKWQSDKEKWAWVVKQVKVFDTPKEAIGKRGIKFTKSVSI